MGTDEIEQPWDEPYWLRQNMEEFKKRADDGDEDFKELLAEIERRPELLKVIPRGLCGEHSSCDCYMTLCGCPNSTISRFLPYNVPNRMRDLKAIALKVRGSIKTIKVNPIA